MVNMPFKHSSMMHNGYECKNWNNQHCEKIYMKLTETYINFLIGSACLTLALIIIVAPILILVYKTTVQKITRVQPTREYSIMSVQEYSNQTVQANNNQPIQENTNFDD